VKHDFQLSRKVRRCWQQILKKLVIQLGSINYFRLDANGGVYGNNPRKIERQLWVWIVGVYANLLLVWSQR
jgi:hypothetical protein